MPKIIVYSALIPKIFGAKIILDIHDPFVELFALRPTSRETPGLATRLVELEERASVAFANHLI